MTERGEMRRKGFRRRKIGEPRKEAVDGLADGFEWIEGSVGSFGNEVDDASGYGGDLPVFDVWGVN